MWKIYENLKVTPLNSFYPTVYTMEYLGNDETMLAKLQALNVLGSFTKQTAKHQGVPQFENEKLG